MQPAQKAAGAANADPTPELLGQFDRVVDGQASGWLFDRRNPERRIEVEVLCDDKLVGKGLADQRRDDLIKAGIGDGECAFFIELDSSPFDGQSHQLVARAAESGTVLRGSPISVEPDAPARPSGQVRGHLDRISNGLARGWAFDPESPESTLRVEIRLGDRVVGSGIADRFRRDLESVGIGDGKHAFEVTLEHNALTEGGQPTAWIASRNQCLPGRPKSDEQFEHVAVEKPRAALKPDNPPQPPFENNRDSRFFFPSSRHAEALSRLFLLTQDRNMGIGALTGEIGAGKTLLRTLLYARLDNDRHVRVSIENSLLDFDGLLLEILSQMQGERLSALRYPDRYTRLAAFKRLLSELVASRDRHLVVMIDEAQQLSIDALEALKGLTNIASERQNFLTLLLIGQPELRTRLKQLPQVDQRVSLRFHLTGLDRSETGYYVRHRFRAAGFRGEPPVSEPALDLIYQATGGTPREINRLCKLALEHVLTHDGEELDEHAITVVVNDLRQHGAIETITDEL